MKQETSPNPVEKEKRIQVISYVLLFLMMVCFVMTIDSLIRNALPHWPSGMISGIVLFIVLDRLYTYQSFKSLVLLSPEWAKSVGAQWVVIIVFIKLLLSYADGPDAFLSDMSLFAHGEFTEFFDPKFFVTLLFAALAWYLLGQFLDLLEEIGLDQELALRGGSAPLQSNVLPNHQRLTNLVFNTGIALVILAALTRVNLRVIFSDTLPQSSPVDLSSFSGGEVGALLYFALGLALLSQSRLISLQTRWSRQRIPVSSGNLSRQWGVYSFLFLLLLIVLVGLLPAGDSLGFFSLLATLLNFLLDVLLVFVRLVIFLTTLIFSLPFLLFGKDTPTPNEVLITPTPVPDVPVAQIADNAFWLIAKSVILWGALAAIIIFSLIAYTRQHGGLVATIRQARFVKWIVLAWQWLRSNADAASKSLSAVIADGWQNILSRLENRRVIPRPAWLSPRSLDPRRQIYFFYLAMVRRGDDRGLPRKPSQTPAEYSAMLERALSTTEKDVSSITEAFIKARYSRGEVEPKEANLVKAAWGRVRQELQTWGKSKRNK